jgi:membrane protein
VALNQAWGVTKSRNYLQNQVIAFGLAIMMVVLGMASILLNAAARGVLDSSSFTKQISSFIDFVLNFTYQGTSFVLLAATTGVASILFFFSIYWLLPNRKVPWRSVLRTSIYTGVIWLAARYLFVLVLPHLDLRELYGPFFISVGSCSGPMPRADSLCRSAVQRGAHGRQEKPYLGRNQSSIGHEKLG